MLKCRFRRGAVDEANLVCAKVDGVDSGSSFMWDGVVFCVVAEFPRRIKMNVIENDDYCCYNFMVLVFLTIRFYRFD